MKPGDNPSRFYDVETGGPIQIQLERDNDEFKLLRQFGYRDPAYDRPFVVPKDLGRWRTDLASIPWMFAWLVPGLGTHLAAVLLHDGLIPNKDEVPPTHDGPDVDREEADRILRDAMATLGVPVVRRWIMWTGVIIGTALSTLRPRWYWIPVISLTLLIVIILGVVATLDVLDVWDVLPWMGERWWLREVLLGGLFAVAVPLVLSWTWLRLWRAGAIAGVGIAFLLHVTAAVMLVFGLYRLFEAAVSQPVEGASPSVPKNVREMTVGAD